MKLILQAIRSLFRKVEKHFEAVISAPKSATVGQMLVVKAVDEDGKPTEWEAVDMPEQANADWNQNDPKATGYVENRTHYEDGENVKQLDEKFIPDSIARKVSIPAAPMMVTTRSIDAGSAFDPSATFAEMLEALEKGATVWVQISGYRCLVTTFSTTKIQCRGLGTKYYTLNSTDSYFR